MARKKKRSGRESSRRVRDPVTEYARAITAGSIIAGPHVRAACARHLRDLDDSPGRGLVWDVRRADHVIGFFRDVLRLSGGEYEGAQFIPLPWQQFIIGSLFGWCTRDGYRRYRVAYVETAKGSGKSPLAAGIGLYMLTADGEPRAEVYAAATKKDQARVLFRDAIAMVELSPDLAARCRLSGGIEKHGITHLASDSFFRPLSSEERGIGQSGPRPHCGILDEIHEHATNAMVEFMRAGTKTRRQPLVLMITNAGQDPRSPCGVYHEYATRVAGGEVEDDTFFGFVAALELGDDPLADERCWIKANPSLPALPGMKYLREQVREARGMPSKEALVRRLNFCEWVESTAPWLERSAWIARLSAEITFEALADRRVYVALDLSAKLDLTAAAVIAEPIGDGDPYDAHLTYWTPASTLAARERRDRAPYAQWVREGHLIAVPGSSIDYAFIADWLARLREHVGDLVAIGFDRWRIDDLERELDRLDLPIARVDGTDAGGADTDLDAAPWARASGGRIALVPHGQGFRDMTIAIEMVEEALAAGTLRVAANPVTTMCVANAAVVSDPAGNRKFTKLRSSGRIDGAVALAMAARLAMRAPAADDDTRAFAAVLEQRRAAGEPVLMVI